MPDFRVSFYQVTRTMSLSGAMIANRSFSMNRTMAFTAVYCSPHAEHEVTVLAFCLMPNHIHAICVPRYEAG